MTTQMQLPDSPSQYNIKETLYTGSRTAVYRATHPNRTGDVIIKVLNHPHPTVKELMKFRNQYTISRHLEHPHLRKPLALERYGNSYALVLEDEGFVPLSQYSQDKQQTIETNISWALNIALQMAEVLSYLSKQHIIHKDIKPKNILIHPTTQQIKLIDFSIASLLPQEKAQFNNPNTLEGTLAYISPEQTGRMNRGLDYRTDFYSLGITLFELLVGALPFKAKDPLELIHCHMARPITFFAPHNKTIPNPLQAILLKLMAKNAEERYQSAAGLKYDLQRCQEQWEATRTIAPFELGTQDICDRFLIAEKLYGRKKEVETLLSAFDRTLEGHAELMLVAGFSGVGKTAVVNEIHKPIVQRQGYFIKGKFDQFNRNIPLSGFVQALRSLVQQILSESEQGLNQWKQKILKAVGEDGQVLIEVIPELSQVIGPQPSVSELSGSAAQNRFNRLFSQFIQLFTTANHPLVIFLDDLQWADSASLKLMERLLENTATGYLLILGAYRDNEVFPAHPLLLTLDALAQQNTPINTLTLAPLSQTHITDLVSETLRCSQSSAEPLAELVHQKTQGNPFFTTQFLQELYAKGWISFNYRSSVWQCDLTPIRQLTLTEDVVTLIIHRLKKLPDNTQQILRMAACIGNHFNLETLAIVSECSQEVAGNALWNALNAGFIIPETDTYKFFQKQTAITTKQERESTDVLLNNISVSYRFLHDRIQQAAYSPIPDSQKQAIHLAIGRLLLRNLSAENQETRLFEIVNQLNTGRAQITQPAERLQLAHLNQRSARKAKAAAAYAASLNALTIAAELLPKRTWSDHYHLTLAIYLDMAEAAYLNGEFKLCHTLINIVFEQGKTTLDKVKAYEINVKLQMAQLQMEGAIETALQALEALGYPLATALPDINCIRLPNLAELEHYPIMTAPEPLAALRILQACFGAILTAKPQMMPLVIWSQVKLCLDYGHSPLAAGSYAWYATILCGAFDEVEKGLHAADLALALLEQFPDKAQQSLTYNMVYSFVHHWRAHTRDCLGPLQQGAQAGLETGQYEYLGYCATNYSAFQIFLGDPLNAVKQRQQQYHELLTQLKLEHAIYKSQIWLQVTDNLTTPQNDPSQLEGDFFSARHLLPQLKAEGNGFALMLVYLAQTLLAYWFNDPATALETSKAAKPYTMTGMGSDYVILHNFYDSLSCLAQYPLLPTDEQAIVLEQVKQNQALMQKWAEQAPMNYRHRWHLVEAERYHVQNMRSQAMDAYDQAIQAATANNYPHEAALAHELAARFYLNWGKEKVAAGYLQEAYYAYAHWGANTKVTYLEKKYPALLASVLGSQQNRQHALTQASDSLTTLATSSVSSEQAWVDLLAIVKASQAISQEIEWKQLLNTLMQNAIATAGAQIGHLILRQDHDWVVVATVEDDTTQLCKTPLSETANLPKSVVHRVLHTQEMLLHNNLSAVTDFAADPYIIQHQPKSAVCTTLTQGHTLIGALYLENNLAVGVFTPARIETIKLLMSQAAISLEISQLYKQQEQYSQTLEVEVEHKTNALQKKTHDLEQALDLLKGTNQALLQTTKLKDEFLANMSHELRTPLNAILGLTETLQEKVLGDLNSKQQQALTTVFQSGTHLLSLINDILDLSKIESGKIDLDCKEASIEAMCNISLDFIKHQAYQKKIQLTVELAPHLPNITVDERRIRQALINLLNNAVKFTPEKGSITLQVTLETQPSVLSRSSHRATSEGSSNSAPDYSVRFAVIDTGIGISQTDIQKLFQPFVQIDSALNRQYAGTGLGLSLVRRIAELHGGKVGVSSDVGAGSEFWFSLPCPAVTTAFFPKPTIPQATASHSTLVEHHPKIQRILLAEDNTTNIETVSTYLTAKGYTIILAKNGAEAIALTKKERPDLVLMDIQMPVMDGLEATQKIRDMDDFKELPIIALTAMAMRGDRERCMEAGATTYLSKPIQLKKLTETIRQTLETTPSDIAGAS